MRSKAASAAVKQNDSEDYSDVEEFEADLNTKKLEDEKSYLNVQEAKGGDMRLNFFLPPFNLDDL